MNVIVFGKRGVARHVPVHGVLVPCMLAGLLLLGGGGFAAGYMAAGGSERTERVEELAALKSDIEAQQSVLSRMRAAAQEQVDALAIRVGELQANVIRLNALGRRLTGMAELEDGEFDFDSPPAFGGPEEASFSTATGQVSELLSNMDHLGHTLSDQEQQLVALEGLMMNRRLQQRVYPQGSPVRSGWISSYFGRRTDPFTGKSAYHRGVDFAGKRGSEVVAVAAGVVTYAGERRGYGKLVEISHGNGYVTRYAHNEQNLVAVGDSVQPGQNIALMGSSGRATGPNLHFEVWHMGRPVNPSRHIRQTT